MRRWRRILDLDDQEFMILIFVCLTLSIVLIALALTGEMPH